MVIIILDPHAGSNASRKVKTLMIIGSCDRLRYMPAPPGMQTINQEIGAG